MDRREQSGGSIRLKSSFVLFEVKGIFFSNGGSRRLPSLRVLNLHPGRDRSLIRWHQIKQLIGNCLRKGLSLWQI